LATKQAEYERVQRQIARLPDADPRTTLESEVYPALTKVFDEGVGAFRTWLRSEVERESSEVFLKLTTEEDYTGLKINDQYGLRIVAKGDRVIPERSAGAEQVVALSLIAGLNRCTGKDAPVVMDTPFGRLDTEHGKNILDFLPTLAAQVVLLVQPRELDRERDLPHLAGKVSHEYQIVRDGSPTRSRIEEL
jgi:DNA sulfur modification protein DndD